MKVTVNRIIADVGSATYYYNDRHEESVARLVDDQTLDNDVLEKSTFVWPSPRRIRISYRIRFFEMPLQLHTSNLDGRNPTVVRLRRSSEYDSRAGDRPSHYKPSDHRPLDHGEYMYDHRPSQSRHTSKHDEGSKHRIAVTAKPYRGERKLRQLEPTPQQESPEPNSSRTGTHRNPQHSTTRPHVLRKLLVSTHILRDRGTAYDDGAKSGKTDIPQSSRDKGRGERHVHFAAGT